MGPLWLVFLLSTVAVSEVDFALELVAGGASSSVAAVSIGLMFSGCVGGYGCCGSEEDGSSSSFP